MSALDKNRKGVTYINLDLFAFGDANQIQNIDSGHDVVMAKLDVGKAWCDADVHL